MGQQIPLPFPVKGVVRNVLRSEQPPGTTWNALNILPYDRFDRPRGGQRPGTAKFYSNQLLDVLGNPAPIQGILQSTFAINPGDGTTLLKRDSFQDGGSIVALTTYDAAYETRHTASANYFTAVGGTVDTTTTNPAWVTGGIATARALGQGCSNGAPTAWGSCARYKTAYVPGSSVLLRAFISPFAGAGLSPSFYLSWGLATSAIGNAVTVELNTDGKTVSIFSGSTLIVSQAVATIFPTHTDAYTSLAWTLELRLTGTTCQAVVNGNVIATGTVTAPTGNQYAFGGTSYPGLFASPIGFNAIELYAGVISSDLNRRQTVVTVVAGGSIYTGPVNGSLTLLAAGLVFPTGIVSMAAGQGLCFIADGVAAPKVVDLRANAMFDFSSTAGTTPQDCRIAMVWRDRCILAAQKGSEQNFYMSRVGTYTDWDFGQADPAAAVAGNASTAGHIGEPLTALIPFNDDLMLLGGDHNLWAVRGDPADGGTIDLVSDQIGVYGFTSWAKDPVGTIYFAGPGGFYRMAPNAPAPEWLSQQSYNQFFTSIDRSLDYVVLAWDRDAHGCWLFVTPLATGSATHVFFDTRNGGFWPIQFPDSHGPLAAFVPDANTPQARSLVVGGRDGYLRQLLTTSLDDDGGLANIPVAISTSISYGPIQPNGDGDTVVESIDITLGEKAGAGEPASVVNASYLLRGGKSAFEVTEGTSRRVAGGRFTRGGRQLSRAQRLRGRWFGIDFSNAVIDTYFSVEQVTLVAMEGGKQR